LFLWGGGQVFGRKKPDLLPLPADLDAYDLIILGTPVWAGSPAPAMVSFLSARQITGKKLALFCCHGGGKGRALEKLKALLPGNTILGETDFVNPAKKGRAALEEKIAAWLKTLEATNS